MLPIIKKTGNFYKIFNNLMLYSNELMNIYENAIKDSKANLQKNTKTIF